MITSSGHFTKTAGPAQPLQYLKGVGPRRSALFAALGIQTVGELLYYFPRDWQDRRETVDLSLPTASGLVVVQGRVLRAGKYPAGPTLALYKATLATRMGKVGAVWFKHRSRRFDIFSGLTADVAVGNDVWIVGRAAPDMAGIREIHVDEYYPLADERWGIHVQRLTPIYPLHEGLSQRLVRELLYRAAHEAAPQSRDAIPAALLEKRQLLSAPQAFQAIHFPRSAGELDAARARLAYEELLLLELAWILKRRQTRGVAKGFGYEIKRTLLTPFRKRLGFELTAAQRRVINELFADLQQTYPMTRLLQGDVGSGKTVVALAALLLAVENGYQGALMAPTEILADQHMATALRLFEGMPVRVGVLTARVPKKERLATLQKIRLGEIDIVIGTHALLEHDVMFPNLKLVVVDEQHRFGVRQRATLRGKSSHIDLLVMTATPIPRTLALSLYGDLDVSVIDEMPPGRIRVTTVQSNEEQALAALKAAVAAGRQGFIVYPIIEESTRLDLQAAKTEFERLSAGPLRGLKVDLLHGAMPGKQKAKVMRDFAAGRVQVLIATQVIEVGIDVPNATVMVIQNAERFGLASLHQLRGRIGRGADSAHCFLVGKPSTEQAQARLATLVASTDGFRIGEEDLKLRGPGEFMGTAQHGELSLQIADILKDGELLAQARQDAEELLAADSQLRKPAVALLRQRLLGLYQKQWEWIDLA